MPTVLIVAGEASADLHGSNLVRELRTLRPDVRVLGAGGPRMREAGVEIIQDPTGHATVGFSEAVDNLGSYLKLFRRLTAAIHSERPDVAVLIDLPDFNMKLGRHLKECGVPIVYYISPQVWAWKEGRIKVLARMVSKMLVIFEFEAELYRREGVDVRFVGHPLLDVIDPARKATGLRRETGVQGGERLVGLLPGSRAKEIEKLYPAMLESARRIVQEHPGTRFVVGCAPGIDEARLAGLGHEFPEVRPTIVKGRTYEVMSGSDLLILASGTATIEATLFGTPMVVIYRVSGVSWFIYRRVKKIPWISLPNIVAGREVVPELLQDNATPEGISRAVLDLLSGERLNRMRQELEEIRRTLGAPGASARAAASVAELLPR